MYIILLDKYSAMELMTLFDSSIFNFVGNLQQFSSVAQSCPILKPLGLKHARFPCLSPTARASTNSCPLSQWCHPTISSSVIPFSSCLQSSPASGCLFLFLFFPWVSSLHQVAKYWSFSFTISLSNEYWGLISFRMDWLDLLAIQGNLKSLLQHHSSKASVLCCSVFFMFQISHPYTTTGKTIALTTWTFVGK